MVDKNRSCRRELLFSGSPYKLLICRQALLCLVNRQTETNTFLSCATNIGISIEINAPLSLSRHRVVVINESATIISVVAVVC